ncbi:MAG: DUF6519 domain-containing protein [bacterium]
MKGDFTTLRHDPTKNYSRVLRQQGRVDLDADWNEAAAIHDHLREQFVRDAVGPAGGPRHAAGFAIGTPNDVGDFDISAGLYYVHGKACRLDGPVRYFSQPMLPAAPRLDLSKAGSALAYLDVWERHVSALEDPSLLDAGLRGLDTATRVQTVAQVKVQVVRDAEDGRDAATEAIRTDAVLTIDAPPVAPGKGRYRGSHDCLYRIEVHDGGAAYGWPRPNAIEAVEVGADAYDDMDKAVHVPHRLCDGRLWQVGQWVEVYGADTEAAGQPGALAQVVGVDGRGTTLQLDRSLPDVGAARRVRRVATWKWARDNASVAYSVATVDAEAGGAVVLDPWAQDAPLALRVNDAVELQSVAQEMAGEPGTLHRIADIEIRGRRVVLDPPVKTRPDAGAESPSRLRLRRWASSGPACFPAGGHGFLEGDIEPKIEGTCLVSGDYWTFATRTATATIDILQRAPPQGVRHATAPLAALEWSPAARGGVTWRVKDVRSFFSPAVSRSEAGILTVGDGVSSFGNYGRLEDAVRAAGEGSTVRVLAGIHRLDGPVIVDQPNVTIEGQAGRTVIQAYPGQSALVLRGAGARLSRLTVRGEAAVLVRSEGAAGVSLAACHLDGGGIWITGGSRSVAVADSELSGGSGPGISVGGMPQPGQASAGTVEVRLHGNRIRGFALEGIVVGSDKDLATIEKVELVDNVVTDCARAPRPDGEPRCAIRATRVAGLALRGNRIVGNGGPAGGPMQGVAIRGCTRLQLLANEVAGNGTADVGQPGQAAVHVLGAFASGTAEAAADAALVEGNRFTCPAGPALVVTAIGRLRVERNSLDARGPDHSTPIVGAAAYLHNAGTDPLWPALTATPSSHLAVHVEGAAPATGGASGDIRFCGNDVVCGSGGASAVACVTPTAVIVQGNTFRVAGAGPTEGQLIAVASIVSESANVVASEGPVPTTAARLIAKAASGAAMPMSAAAASGLGLQTPLGDWASSEPTVLAELQALVTAWAAAQGTTRQDAELGPALEAVEGMPIASVASRSCTLAGRVVDPAGQPVAGVQVQPDAPWWCAWSRAWRRSMVTGPDGAFRFAFDGPAYGIFWPTVRLAVQGAGEGKNVPVRHRTATRVRCQPGRTEFFQVGVGGPPPAGSDPLGLEVRPGWPPVVAINTAQGEARQDTEWADAPTTESPLGGDQGQVALVAEPGTTGKKNRLSGVYQCSAHPENTIPLSRGETFPPCGREGGHAARWILLHEA